MNLALEQAVARSVGRGDSPPTLRFWSNRRCLVLGRYDPRRDGFQHALEPIAKADLPVFRRRTGGSAVLHDDGVLNWSIVLPRSRGSGPNRGLEDGYQLLCEGLIRGLQQLGVPARAGELPGTFCDGRYNLLAGEKKIAGTAQTRRQSYQLIHGTLFLNNNLDRMIRDLRAFYRSLPDGGARQVHPDTVTTVRELLGRPVEATEATRVFSQAFSDRVPLVRGKFDPSEVQAARSLAPALRFDPAPRANVEPAG